MKEEVQVVCPNVSTMRLSLKGLDKRFRRIEDDKYCSLATMMFPYTSYLARISLSSPGSSVYSERLFSEIGNVCEQKRNSLLLDKAVFSLFTP